MSRYDIDIYDLSNPQKKRILGEKDKIIGDESHYKKANTNSTEVKSIIDDIFIYPYFFSDGFSEEGDKELYRVLQYDRKLYNGLYDDAVKTLSNVTGALHWNESTAGYMNRWKDHMDAVKRSLRVVLREYEEYRDTTKVHYNQRTRMTPQERIKATEDQILRLTEILKAAKKAGDATLIRKAEYGLKVLQSDLTKNTINRIAEDNSAARNAAKDDGVFTDKEAKDIWYVLKRTIFFGPNSNDTKGYIDWPREMLNGRTDLDVEDVNNKIIDLILDEEGYKNMKNILDFSTGGRMMQEQVHIIHKAFANIIRESKAKGFHYSKFRGLQEYIDKKTREYAMMIKGKGRQGILNALKVVPETKAERIADSKVILNELYLSFYGSHGGARSTRRNRRLKAKRKHTRRA